jgi:hypothetical protein
MTLAETLSRHALLVPSPYLHISLLYHYLLSLLFSAEFANLRIYNLLTVQVKSAFAAFVLNSLA